MPNPQVHVSVKVSLDLPRQSWRSSPHGERLDDPRTGRRLLCGLLMLVVLWELLRNRCRAPDPSVASRPTGMLRSSTNQQSLGSDRLESRTKPRSVVPRRPDGSRIDQKFLLTRQDDPSPFRFAEVAAAAGIDFQHVSGMSNAKRFPTANGLGVRQCSRLRQRRQVGPLLRHCDHAAVGNRDPGAESAPIRISATFASKM